MQLKFTVRGQQIFRVDKTPLASDSRLYIAGAVDFDSEWDDITAVYLTFEPRNGTAITALLTDGMFDESLGVSLSAGTWRVSAHGTNSAGKEIHTTPVLLNVAQAGGRDGEAPPYVPPDAAGQIAAVAEEARETAKEAKAAAITAQDSAMKSAQSADVSANGAASSAHAAAQFASGVERISKEVSADAESAAESRDVALSSAEQAKRSEDTASIFSANAKVSETNAKDAMEKTAVSEGNAKISETNAAESARQAADSVKEGKYVGFTITGDGRLIMRKTSTMDELNFRLDDYGLYMEVK